MSTATTIPLQSYDPDWEARWERANAEFQRWKAIASNRGSVDAEYYRALASMDAAGTELRRAYTAQFRTVGEYRAWRLKWLWNAHAWPWLNIPAMPESLTVNEVRRRLDEAEQYLRTLRIWYPHGPRPDHSLRLREILSAPADPAAQVCADIVRSIGGDHV